MNKEEALTKIRQLKHYIKNKEMSKKKKKENIKIKDMNDVCYNALKEKLLSQCVEDALKCIDSLEKFFKKF